MSSPFKNKKFTEKVVSPPTIEELNKMYVSYLYGSSRMVECDKRLREHAKVGNKEVICLLFDNEAKMYEKTFEVVKEEDYSSSQRRPKVFTIKWK